MIVSANVLVMAKVLGFGEKVGIDISKIPTALAGGFADSIPLQLTRQQMAREVKANTPMSTLAQQLMKHYCEGGYADMDPSALIQE
jgi:3-hydroxyisobutyrate dehydrogenase